MGEAMIVGLIRSGFDSQSIVIKEKRADRRDEVINQFGLSKEPITGSDLVFLAVKPQDAETTISEIRDEISQDALVITLLAGTRIQKLEAGLGDRARVVRVMPNTPLLLGKGATALAKSARASSEDINWAISFFAHSGLALEVAEAKMDAVTATSGSGPAYFFKLVESMISAAVRLGMSEVEAKRLTEETLIGAAKMVEESGKDVSTLRANVTSPNGTTAAALESFDKANFDEIVYQAMKAAKDRSVELSS